MKTNIVKSTLLAAALACSTVFAATPDGLLTTKAKLALMTTGNVKSSAVHLDTNDGVVTMYGTVPSEEQKKHAETVLLGVDGVREVKNMLQVVHETEQKQVAKADKDIKDSVEKALKADARLNDSKITVKSVDKGVVLLSGKANSLNDQVAAVVDADQVMGVRQVMTEVEAPKQYANDDHRAIFMSKNGNNTAAGKTTVAKKDMKDMKDMKEMKNGTLTDTRITSEVKLKLLTTANIPSTEISVDTNNGVVTLFGVVPNATAKADAEAMAAKISDVRKVDNQIQVVPNAKKEFVEKQDKDLKDSLKAAFKDRPELKNVDAEVKAGVIMLTGTVDSGWDRLLAVRLARGLPGTKSVDERLTIKDSAQTNNSF